jgi:hypothetical protein
MPVVDITPQLMAAAFAELEQSKGWTCTFEEAMTHPIHQRLIRATAVGMALARKRNPPRTRWQQARTTGRGIDIKRRAAGDRDDSPQLF